MEADLYKHLQAGGLVLTVNNRLSRWLREDYDQRQASAGAAAWLRPRVLSFAAWADDLLRSLPEGGQILRPAQCQRIWEAVIQEDLGRRSLLQVTQTARRAHQAHQLLIRYGVDFTADQAARDQQAFLRWRDGWQRLADKQGWLDAAAATGLVATALREGRCPAPPHVFLAGFEQPAPDVADCIAALAEQGTEVRHWLPSACTEPDISLCPGADPAEEVRRCAHWIRQLRRATPQARIGVVVPRLEAYRSLVDNIFLAELDPPGLVAGEETSAAYNISLARPISAEGPVRAALRLLQTGARLTTDDFGWLLRSPYVGRHQRDGSLRASLDRAVRETRVADWTLADLRAFTGRYLRKEARQPGDCSSLLDALMAASRGQTRRLPGDWAETFLNELRLLGWPGERSLSSREYQAVEGFQELLGELAGLDRVCQPQSRSETVSVLARLAAGADFQPESFGGEVQILGLLESVGLSFDHLWVLGLHDGALPQPPQPNPFIPLDLQRSAGMERADADREARFAARVADRLFRAAPDVVLSWPRQIDGVRQRPSPLLPNQAAEAPEPWATASPAAVINAAAGEMEMLSDSQAPALHTRKSFTGGTALLKDQALCPFRAFAHHRLHARQLETPAIGIDALARGSLVHYALEFFWKQVAGRAELLAMTGDQRAAAVEQAVAGAIERFEKKRRRDLPVRQKALEKRFLCRLLSAWLEVEAQRAPFVVAELEKFSKVDLGRLTISTRVDRIDRLENGNLALLDYKTGRCDPSQWFDERLTEPQLPVYTLSVPPGRIAAVLFAQVRSRTGECGFRGVSRQEATWPGLASRATDKLLEDSDLQGFDDLLQRWQQALAQLGAAFAAGDARVEPVSIEAACRYCDLTPLCRIHEAGLFLHLREEGHD